MRICLFGGTFDPIHEAHLRIASEAQTQFHLNEILFVPASTPPHKIGTVTPFPDRFRMVEIACSGHPRFIASRLEDLPGPNYTVDTLEKFRQTLRKDDQLFFLIGSDAFVELETWKRWQDVAALTDFIVVSRPGGEYRLPPNTRVHRLDGLALPVSSSSLRARLAAGEETPELPTGVRAYIEEHGLYGAGENRKA
jgi:nicotinate-nucleotide adenylyltransferase